MPENTNGTTVPTPLTCAICHNEFDESDLEEVQNGDLVCEICLRNNYCGCDDCDGLVPDDTTTEVNGRCVCEECYSNYEECENCGNYYHYDDIIDGLCPSCRDNGYIDPDFECKLYQSSEIGNIITSNRKFGIELECIAPTRDSFAILRNELPKGFGIVSDGSLESGGNYKTLEIVSPPLQGKAGEDAILQVCKILHENEFLVNGSCGYHLHLESKDLSQNQANIKFKKKQKIKTEYVRDSLGRNRKKEKIYSFDIPFTNGSEFKGLRRLLATYHVFDEVFRSMQPKTRRNNHYCLPVSSLYSLQEITECEDYSEIENLFYKDADYENVVRRKNGGKYDSARYCGLNLHILFSKNITSEIRYHCGTLNPEKILNWIKLHQTIFDYVVNINYDYTDEYIQDISKINDEVIKLEKKVESMCNLFKLDDHLKNYIINRITKLE